MALTIPVVITFLKNNLKSYYNKLSIDTLLGNKEDYLGLPDKDGQILSSSLEGERTWIDNTGGSGSTATKESLGLDKVDNTSDLDKPISTLTQDALDAKEDLLPINGTSLQYFRGDKTLATLPTIMFPSAHETSHITGSDQIPLAEIDGVKGLLSGADAKKLSDLSGINTGDQTDIEGNAGTATKLKESVTINDVTFNGSSNIIITAEDITPRIALSEKGEAGGVATLGEDKKVLISQLPSYVEDVFEFPTLADFPTLGEKNKIYVDALTGKTYRWSGTVYIYITSGAVDYVAGKTGIVELDKSDVGLSSVDDTSDLLKPISNDTQNALDLKVGTDQLGMPLGVPTLDEDGYVLSSQLRNALSDAPSNGEQYARKNGEWAIVNTSGVTAIDGGSPSSIYLTEQVIAGGIP